MQPPSVAQTQFCFQTTDGADYIYMSCSIVIITLLLHFYHIIRHVKIRILGFLTNGKTFVDKLEKNQSYLEKPFKTFYVMTRSAYVPNLYFFPIGSERYL